MEPNGWGDSAVEAFSGGDVASSVDGWGDDVVGQGFAEASRPKAAGGSACQSKVNLLTASEHVTPQPRSPQDLDISPDHRSVSSSHGEAKQVRPPHERVGSAGPRRRLTLKFRLDTTGQGGTVLRKVLSQDPSWTEVTDEPDTTKAKDIDKFRLPSIVRPQHSAQRHRSKLKSAVDECHLTWRTGRFKPSEYARANSNRRLNHIPGSSAICKKDQLVRNIRKMCSCYGGIYNFLPTSFIVPSEFTKFTQHFADLTEAGEKSTWICKPSGMSRGRKIFLLSDPSTLSYDRACVVQRYIPRPLLIGGYKMVRVRADVDLLIG